jgi:predicted HicB family RNase H-like nuclease
MPSERKNTESKHPKQAKERMIHVRLPEDMHKKVRIRAAETDQTIQEWVFEAIKRKLERKELKKHGSKV